MKWYVVGLALANSTAIVFQEVKSMCRVERVCGSALYLEQYTNNNKDKKKDKKDKKKKEQAFADVFSEAVSLELSKDKE